MISGLSASRWVSRHLALVGGEERRAQNLEDIERARRGSGQGVCDLHAGARKCLYGARADGGDFALYRQQAEVRAVGDTVRAVASRILRP